TASGLLPPAHWFPLSTPPPHLCIFGHTIGRRGGDTFGLSTDWPTTSAYRAALPEQREKKRRERGARTDASSQAGTAEDGAGRQGMIPPASCHHPFCFPKGCFVPRPPTTPGTWHTAGRRGSRPSRDRGNVK